MDSKRKKLILENTNLKKENIKLKLENNLLTKSLIDISEELNTKETLLIYYKKQFDNLYKKSKIEN